MRANSLLRFWGLASLSHVQKGQWKVLLKIEIIASRIVILFFFSMLYTVLYIFEAIHGNSKY